MIWIGEKVSVILQSLVKKQYKRYSSIAPGLDFDFNKFNDKQTIKIILITFYFI